MRASSRQISRVLAVAPISRGFGYAVLEGKATLVDWGVKSVVGDKNLQSLSKIQTLISQYQPMIVMVPDISHRSKRVRSLINRIIETAHARGLAAASLSRRQIGQVLLSNSDAPRHALAQAVAKQFPDELEMRVPPKRKLWMSEDSRMALFDAVALALALP